MKKYKTNFPIYGNPYSYYGNDMQNYSGYNYMDPMKIPYMNMPLLGETLDDEMEEYDEKDINYMKEMYPDICKKLQRLIEEECNKMEYEGSYMYDEYPDKEAMDMITDKIYRKMETDETLKINETVEKTNKLQKRYNRWLRYLIKIMLLNEVFDRRKRRYNKGRKGRRYQDNYYGSPYFGDQYYQDPYYQNPYNYSNYF